MARRLESEQPEQEQPDDATRQHNVGNRRTVLQQCCAEIRQLEAQAKALAEQKKGINKQIGDVFRRVKSELGLKRTNVEAVLRIIDLEDEERDETLDQIRETYEALRPGEQLDWLDAADKAQAASAPNGSNGAHEPA